MEKTNQDLKNFLILGGAMAFSLFFILTQWHFSSRIMTAQIVQPDNQEKIDEEIKNLPQKEITPIKIKSAPILETGSKAAISLLFRPEKQNLPPRILFEKEINKALPIASISKLMTAVVALENYPLQSKIKITEESVNQEGESGRLKAGETLLMESLLHIMLMESSNDAAEAIARSEEKETFISLMNKKAKEIGLEKTFFVNPSGLDPETEGTPNISSALDLAKLIIYIQKNHPLIGEILSKKDYILNSSDGQFHHSLVSTNSLLYNSQTVWGKTGYTKKANGCMVNLMRPQTGGDSIIINVILGADDRFYEMQKLSDWLNNSFVW